MTTLVRKDGAWVVSGWSRPLGWLSLPTIGAGVQKFAGLIGVTNDSSNYVALKASGNYHVDWGDGTSANVAAGVAAEHHYTYADLDSATLMTRNGLTYRQAIVVVTPQGGQNLTDLNLQVPHSIVAVRDSIPPVALWLDVLVSSSVLATFAFSQLGGDTLVAFPYLEQFELRENALVDASFLISAPQGGTLFLVGRIVVADLPAATNISSLVLLGGGVQGDITVGNAPLATSADTAIDLNGGCGGNVSIGNLNALAALNLVISISGSIQGNVTIGNLPAATSSPGGVFSSNGGDVHGNVTVGDADALVSTVGFILTQGSVFGNVTCGSMDALDDASNFFYFPFNGGVLGSLTLGFTVAPAIIDNMFGGLRTLRTWAFSDASGITSAAGAFYKCTLLSSLLMPGMVVDLNVADCNMSATALAALFTSLGTVSGKTVTVTGNYGSASLSAPQLLIATAKGWTVVQ